MIVPNHYANKNILILGLGKNGKENFSAFQNAGSYTYSWDDQKQNDPFIINNIHIFDAIIQSPGIPPDHFLLKKAKKYSIPIRSDLDILKEVCSQATIIGVTGTNGKSTTTALIGHILNALNYSFSIGGNLSPPILSLAPQKGNGFFVLELSSYQLEITHHIPIDIAVLLNITPDHIDRHHTMELYQKTKFRIFENAKYKIIGDQLIYNSHQINGINFTHPTLLGKHNAQNIAACFAVCSLLGIDKKKFFHHIKTFAGLPHRLQYIGKTQNVSFFNDSKSTNAESTANALKIFRDIFLILGGIAKSDNFNVLLPYIDRIRAAYLIGQSAQQLYSILNDKVPTYITYTLESAILQAYQDACQFQKPCTLLLSPACTSFDQFDNFEQRGQQFIDIVRFIIDKKKI